MLKDTPSAQGSFTDFNVWSKGLMIEEMKNLTLCKSMMKGDFIPWNISDWTSTSKINSTEYKEI